MKRLVLLACALVQMGMAHSYFMAEWNNQGVPGSGLGAVSDTVEWYTGVFITLDPGAIGATVSVATIKGNMVGSCSKGRGDGCIVVFPVKIEEMKSSPYIVENYVGVGLTGRGKVR